MTQRQLRQASIPPEAPVSEAVVARGRPAIGVVTFLAVDLAESSEAMDRLGEDRVESARAAYLTLLRNAVAAHHGRELARQGERVMVMFDLPSDAVSCAVAVQRAAGRHNERGLDRLGVRVGIHLGEADDAAVASENGDYTAQPAVHARQLRDAASGGQILTSGLVASLARTDDSHGFERTGLIDLVGLADPVATFEVTYQDAVGERPPLPAELATPPSARCSFVGRSAERERLRATWAASAGGQRRLAFVTGEPGVGKSRLAAEFATEAHADGAVVLSGRSFEESIVPYQPFVEALRRYVADCDPVDLETQLGGDAASFVALVPELATRFPVDAALGHGGDERYRMFDAVAALLASISISSPVLILLDDLQWADQATLLLLKHIALDSRPASMLILGTYRDTEVDFSHPLTRLMADIERDAPIDRIALGGLDDKAVESMLDEMIGWSPPPDVAQGLRSETEGNPFFLQELIHHLDETGVASDRERMTRGQFVSGEHGVPVRIRDFVARRMQRLSTGSLEVLGVAAVVGTEFSLDVLEAVLSIDADRLVDHLDEVVEAGLVVEAAGRSGTYAFAHGLFQQALHDRHSANRRVMLHARVAEAIEALRPDDPSTLSDLARHYALAAGRYAEKVVHYGSAAGDRALAGLAYEDAIEEYERALAALPLVPSADELTQADLLVRLGEAQTHAGDERWRRSFLDAAGHCSDAESWPVLARAAIGYGGISGLGGVFNMLQQVDEALVGLLERALADGPGGDHPTRVHLLGRLARALYWSDDKDRVHALSQEALDAARRIGDRTALAHALDSHHTALWGPDHVAELRVVAEEMLAVGQSLGDRDIQLRAYLWLIADALEAGTMEAVDRYSAAYAQLAEQLRRPYHLAIAAAIRAMRAHLEGRFDDAIRLSSRALDYGHGPYTTFGRLGHLVQTTFLQLDLGQVDDEIIAGLVGSVERTSTPAWRSLLAHCYASMGQTGEAAAALAWFTPERLAVTPRDCMWSDTMGMLSQVVAELDDVELARPLYELQLPYAHLNCPSGGVILCLGPVSRFLGMLATTFGEPDVALDHLGHALERSSSLGSPPLIARTQVDIARALLVRGADGDAKQARELLVAARRTAVELGMTRLAEVVDGIERSATDTSPNAPVA